MQYFAPGCYQNEYGISELRPWFLGPGPFFCCKIVWAIQSTLLSLQKRTGMQILQEPVSREDLKIIARNTFGDMVKCVADVRQGILAIDANLHADLETALLENGSAQQDLWGFNLWVEEEGEDFIEYDSLINIRSWQGNPSRDVLNPQVRKAIADIVHRFIVE